jgi:hypothetical protein
MMKKIVHALGLRPMARTLPVCHTACEVLTAFLALCWPAAAEEKQSVRIHIQYSTYAERVRPFPFSATVSHDITAILSGKNTIQDYVKTQAAIFGQDDKRDMSLGKTTTQARWHVVSPSKLVRIYNWPQSQTTMTVTVHGSTCTADVEYRLRPGFTEYKFWDIQLNDWAFYNPVKFVSATCTIEPM